MKQLSTWVTPYMISHFRNVWSDSTLGGRQRAMVVFQEKCAEVPKWNQDTIDANVNKLLDNCRCDYLEELMAAVFIAHTKVLIAIRVSSKHKKLQITLPKLDHFLHRIFSECARSFWKTPFLFLDTVQPIEMQKNILQAEALCADAISSAVRSLLPIKNILNEYLSDDVLAAEPIIEKGDEVKTGGGASEPIIEKGEEAKALGGASEPVVPMEEPKVVEDPLQETKSVRVSPKPVSDIAQPVSVPVSVPVPVAEQKKEKKEKKAVESPEEVVIDTEQAVHFSNYDNVFDENSDQVASYKYVPKDDSEPHLEIREETAQPLAADLSVTNLEAPGASSEPAAESGLVVDEILD